LGADGCKAQRAANGRSIGKRRNAADAAPKPNPNPKGRKAAERIAVLRPAGGE